MVRTAVAGVLALVVVAVQPAPARADTFGTDFFPAHWGPNPYVGAVPPQNLNYRAVYLIDNTNDPSLSQHIQTMANIINYLHVVYNPNFPVIAVFKDYHFAVGDPCALGPAQFLVVCKAETIEGVAAGAPGAAEIFPGPANHIYFAVARIRPSVVDPWCSNDKFRLAVQLISNTLGLDQNLSNSASALFPTILVGGCTFTGWTEAEFHRMNLMYSHLTG